MIDFIYKITIRARVALYLAVAESLFNYIKKDEKGYAQARSALDKCWKWLDGEEVAGDTLYEYLENEDDTGLLVFGSMAAGNPPKLAVWNTFATALMYVIWQAYEVEGEKYLPQTIEEVNETMIDDLLSCATESNQFNISWFEELKQYLLEKYPANEPNQLGKPISKIEVMELLIHSR
jgi:Immunity protein Imm6